MFKAVPKDFVNAARAFGATRTQVLTRVLLPASVPSILTGIRIALGTGWSTLVAAELVAATRGLGFMIQSAAQFLVTDIVIAGIVVIAIIAFALEWLARLIERRFVPWAIHYAGADETGRYQDCEWSPPWIGSRPRRCNSPGDDVPGQFNLSAILPTAPARCEGLGPLSNSLREGGGVRVHIRQEQTHRQVLATKLVP